MGIEHDYPATPEMKAPPPSNAMAAAVALLAGGIVAGRYAGATAGLPLAGAALGLLVSFLFARRPGGAVFTRAALAAAIFLLGAADMAVNRYSLRADQLAGAVSDGPMRPATLTGRLAGAVQTDLRESQSRYAAYRSEPRSSFLLAADAVSTGETMSPCRSLVRVTVDGVCPELPVGGRLRVSGILGRIPAPRNPSVRDRRERERLNGIHVSLFAANPQLVELIAPPTGPGVWLASLRGRLSSAASARLSADCDDDTALTLNAIVLGRRDRALESLRQAMVRSGTAHLLSISGLHLAILTGFAVTAMRIAGLSPRATALATLAMLAAYLLTVEARAPVLRGAIMLAMVCAGVLTDRRGGVFNGLCAAAALLLALDPQELFRPGFQLSFGVTAGLAFFYEPVREALFGRMLAQSELRVFNEDQPAALWWHHQALPGIAAALSASVAAYAASIPLVAYHFGIFTPLAPLASLVLLPLVVATLILGYLKLATAWLLPGLASTMGRPTELTASAMGHMARWLGRIGPCVDLPRVPPGAAMLLGVGVFLALGGRKIGLPRRASLATASLAIALSVLWIVLPGAGDEVTLTILDVRNGQTAVLAGGDCETTLLDAGSRSLAEPGAMVLQPMLRARRLGRVRHAFISHGDADHFNAAAELIAEGQCPQVYTSRCFGAAKVVDGKFRSFENLIAAHCRRRTLTAGDAVTVGPRTTIDVLGPDVDLAAAALESPGGDGYEVESDSENDLSMVLMLQCGANRVLLPGDIREAGIRRLLELSPEKLKAEVLVLPHHGSWAEGLDALVAAVDPAIVIRSSGRRSDGATEHIATLTTGRRFYATDRDGAITLTFSDEGVKVRTKDGDGQ